MGISREEALDALRSNDLIGIGMEADAVRRRLHPENVVSYAVTARADCSEGDPQVVLGRALEVLSAGGSGLILAGAAQRTFQELLSIIEVLRKELPDIWISGLTLQEIAEFAGEAQDELSEMFTRLIGAGWNGPEPSTGEVDLERSLFVHGAAHRAGLRTGLTVGFGNGESLEVRVDRLLAIERQQEQTGGFVAIALDNGNIGISGPTAVERLKLLGVLRLVLEAIPSIEAGGPAQTLKTLETMLRFGANDAGEVRTDGASSPDLREEDLRRVIRDAGFAPVERDPGYRFLLLK